MVVVAPDFKAWLKGATGMRLNTNAAVKRIIAEGVTSFDSMADFDTKSIQGLPTICRETIPAIAADLANGIEAVGQVRGANISTMSVQRLIVAHHAVKFYTSIGRPVSVPSMNYTTILSKFKEDYDAYLEMRKQDKPDVPLINDKDQDRKIIKWVPVFTDCCDRTFGTRGPLRYKLRMMGIPVEGPTYVFGDNQSVLCNTSMPHSSLKKKSSSIAFHYVREGVAKDKWRTAYLNTHDNPSDMLTKSLPGGEKRTKFISMLLHYVT